MLDDGSAVIVNRGWVPIDVAGPPVPSATPPTTNVTVEGLVRESQVRDGFGPTDPPTGILDRVARVDVERLQQQSSYELVNFYVDLEQQIPAQPRALPAGLEPPELSEGPHLSYAIQWFIFTGLVVVGYPILLYRTAQPGRKPPEETVSAA